MKRLILTTCLCVLFMVGGSSSAAPLEPINTAIDVSIGGIVHINGNFPSKHAGYNWQEHLNRFTSGDTPVAASVMAGNPHISSISIAFKQIAFDGHVSTVMGQSLRTETPELGFGNLEGQSALNVYSDFLVLGLPFQPLGEASIIPLELERFGNLPSINNGRAHNQASAPSPGLGFSYDSFMDTPKLPTVESEWNEFTGTRNITRNGSILTYVGETINLFAESDSNVFANASAKSNF